VVHGFRPVVGDSGANTGLIVSSTGFQGGAIEAASYSNVRLLTWVEFQAMFARRWFTHHMSPTLGEETAALHEYTEPINSRIARKANELDSDRREHFMALRRRYLPLATTNIAFHPIVLDQLFTGEPSSLPTLPLRTSTDRPRDSELEGLVPDDVLDATALRPLMDALIEHSRCATAEFDDVFGERV
jgi:hypothetical protein